MRTVSSKSAHLAALMPILVAMAEPQLPEPMSATFSGMASERSLSKILFDQSRSPVAELFWDQVECVQE
jgi:hypothetical protein